MYLVIPPQRVKQQLEQMDVHPVGVDLMAPKAEVLPLKILGVKSPAANIIKQEMLSLGGECATAKGAITCSIDSGHILLFGTRAQYARLAKKLQSMANWFGLGDVIADLQNYLKAQPLTTVLADGRVLTYEKMRVMGILNATPDSFFAGSRVQNDSALLKKAETMLQDGADILDIGGESTRPGSDPVSPEEEVRRVVNAVRQIRQHFPKSVISVDTYHARTAEAALTSGADIINDITAGEGDPKMLAVAAAFHAPVILMHMRGTPQTMTNPENQVYKNVAEDVTIYLLERAREFIQKGFTKQQLILDPGLGFAKNKEQNLALCRDLPLMTAHGMPVLLAGSRKGFIGKVLGDLPAEERLEGTMALSAAAFYGGAQLVRVHDVKENVRLLRMLEAIGK